MVTDKENKQFEPEVVAAEAGVHVDGAEEGASTAEGVNMAEETVESHPATEKMADDSSEWHDKYLRLSAEFDNYRKRTLREKMELISSAGEDVIKALLPVVDDLERALCATEKVADVNAVREGVVLISNKMRDTLRTKGLVEIEAFGKELDTDFHEAIAKVPAEKKQKGKIVDVVQKGYKLNDKVIRHCKVVVGE